jgi:hypothetical protein
MSNSNQVQIRRGAVAVEVAVVIIIVFFMVFCAIEFSRAVMLKYIADTVAYETVRHVIVPGGTIAEGQELGDRLLRMATVRQASLEFQPSVINEATESVSVTVRMPYRENSWIAPMFFGGRTIESKVTLLTERNPFEQARAAFELANPPPPPDPNPPPPDDDDDDDDDDDASPPPPPPPPPPML